MFISVLFWLCEASNYVYMTALLFLSGLRMHPRHLQNPLAKCQAPRCHKTSLVDLEFHLQGRKELYIYIYIMNDMNIKNMSINLHLYHIIYTSIFIKIETTRDQFWPTGPLGIKTIYIWRVFSTLSSQKRSPRDWDSVTKRLKFGIGRLHQWDERHVYLHVDHKNPSFM